jgi:hypothetical protein
MYGMEVRDNLVPRMSERHDRTQRFGSGLVPGFFMDSNPDSGPGKEN